MYEREILVSLNNQKILLSRLAYNRHNMNVHAGNFKGASLQYRSAWGIEFPFAIYYIIQLISKVNSIYINNIISSELKENSSTTCAEAGALAILNSRMLSVILYYIKLLRTLSEVQMFCHYAYNVMSIFFCLPMSMSL